MQGTYTDYMKKSIIDKINEATDEGLIRYVYTMLMETITSNTKDEEKDAEITETQAANF